MRKVELEAEEEDEEEEEDVKVGIFLGGGEFSIVRYSKEHNVSETGSVSVLR
jgi:hypothetical protein